MDIEHLAAIDVHTHAEVSAAGHMSLSPELMAASEKYFGAQGHRRPTIDEIASYYRERAMAAVVFTVDAEHATGHPPIRNEEVAEACGRHSDTLIPFASLDPWRGRAAVREARRLVEEYGVLIDVYIDLSGWSPKYFPPQLVHYAGSLLKHKMLFGSDYPVITPGRWPADFDKLDLKPEVRRLILKDNAVALLGLGSD